MSKSLLALSDESRLIREQLESMVDPETGEIPENALEAIINNQIEIAEKLDGYLDFIVDIDKTVSMFEERKKVFDKKVKSIKSIKDRIRESIRKYMASNCLAQIKTTRTISLVPDKDKLDIDMELLQKEYVITRPVTVIETVANEEKIMSALKSGKTIPGANFITNRSHITVKG